MSHISAVWILTRNTRVDVEPIRLSSKPEAVCRNSSRSPGLALKTSVSDKYSVSSISGCVAVVWSIPGRHRSTSQSVRWKCTDVVRGIHIDKLFSQRRYEWTSGENQASLKNISARN